jgi:hypothetical protein
MDTASRVALNSRHLMSGNLSVQTSSRKKLLALQSLQLEPNPKMRKRRLQRHTSQCLVSVTSDECVVTEIC